MHPLVLRGLSDVFTALGTADGEAFGSNLWSARVASTYITANGERRTANGELLNAKAPSLRGLRSILELLAIGERSQKSLLEKSFCGANIAALDDFTKAIQDASPIERAPL